MGGYGCTLSVFALDEILRFCMLVAGRGVFFCGLELCFAGLGAWCLAAYMYVRMRDARLRDCWVTLLGVGGLSRRFPPGPALVLLC